MSLYCLVLFVDDENPNNIEVVPTEWLFYDKTDEHLCCRFLNEQPTPKESRYFQNLVKNRNPPAEYWNYYRVEVQGVADTYNEAVDKLIILNRHKHTSSTDDDEKIRMMQEEIKQKCFLKGGNKPDMKKKHLMSSHLDLTKAVNKSNHANYDQPESLLEEDNSQDNSNRSNINSPSKSKSTGAIPKSKSKGLKSINKNDLRKELITGANKSQFRHFVSNNQAHTLTKVSLDENISEDSDSHSDGHSTSYSDTRRSVFRSTSNEIERNEKTASQISSKHKSLFNINEIKDIQDLADFMCKHFICSSQQLGNIQSDINALKSGFHRLSNPQASGPTQETKRLLRLPIRTKKDFEKLNNSLKKENSKERDKLLKEIKQIVWYINMPNKGLVKNLTGVMTEFFTTEMINQLTSQKQAGDKSIFKFTEFGLCLFEIMRENLAHHGIALEDKEFYDAVGRVIKNAKSWHKEN